MTFFYYLRRDQKVETLVVVFVWRNNLQMLLRRWPEGRNRARINVALCRPVSATRTAVTYHSHFLSRSGLAVFDGLPADVLPDPRPVSGVGGMYAYRPLNAIQIILRVFVDV